MAFSRRHYRAVSPPADTAADVALRKADSEARRLARFDVEATYPTVTAENASEVLTFQEGRIRHHRARLNGNGHGESVEQ